MRLISAAVVAVSAILQVQSAVLTGSVVDATGTAIPGATVRISATGSSASAVSDGMGRFRFDDLAGGTYRVTVSLAGFRSQTTAVRVDSSVSPEITVKLATGVLSEVLWVVPQPAEAYRMAAAIAFSADRKLASGF